MSFAALMVHFDGKPSSYQRLRLAVDMANRFNAALIGVAGRLYLPPSLANGNADQPKKNEQQQMAHVLAEIGNKFRAATEHVAHVEWRGVVGDVSHVVANEARAADLIIIGRGQDLEIPYYTVDPGVAIVRMGRPVLLAPEGIESLEAQRALVAWKDTREARRAVRDAIPLLRRAEWVTVAEVCEYGSEAQTQQRMNDLEEFLFRHGVAVAEKANLHTKQPVADELLRFAKAEKADLLVAGAYGHTRLGEWIFGGATRDLLRHSPICSLFSH